MLQIITDSAADITLRQAEQLGVHIVPIDICFEDGICPQEQDRDFAVFYQRLQQAEQLPVTSRPSPERYLQLFEAAREAGDEVLVLTLSEGLSGTVHAAMLAQQMCEYEKVYIMDSGLAIVAQRMLVEHAVALREQGLCAREILPRLEQLKGRITVYGVIDSLTCLRKGGRIPAGLAMVGNTLKIKPVILLEDGVLKTIGKALGRGAGKRMVYQRFEKDRVDPDFPIYFTYTSDRELADEFARETREAYDLSAFRQDTFPIGGVIGTHLGEQCVGLAYVRKE